MNNLLQQILAPLRGMWPWQQHPQVDTKSPYELEMLKADGIKGLLAARRRDRGIMAMGCFLLASISLSGNYYQLTQQKEFNHIVMVDADFDTVTTLARRADLMPDSDPIKQGRTSKFLLEQIPKLKQRMGDKGFLARDLTYAQSQFAGPALVKFETERKQNDPFKRLEHGERVLVDVPVLPVPVAPQMWLANWRERVEDMNGNFLRTEEWSGYFQVVYDPKRVTPFNEFGAVIVGYQEKKVK